MPKSVKSFFMRSNSSEATGGLPLTLIDLGPMSPLQFAQHQQWHDLLIAGPTSNIVGTTSNDFPGLYYYDPRTQTEYVAILSNQVDWRYCTLGRRIEERASGPHLLLGLFDDHKLFKTASLKVSKRQRILFEAEKNDRDAMPNQWEALRWLISESFDLLPLTNPSANYDWGFAAATCLKTLLALKSKHHQTGEIPVFFETFYTQKNVSDKASETESRYSFTSGISASTNSKSSKTVKVGKKPFPSSSELICQAGLAAALLSYAKTQPEGASAYRALGLEIADQLYNFYDIATGFFQNTFPPKGEEWSRGVIDTWYAFNNLYQVLRTADIAGKPSLTALCAQAVERLVRFVKSCDYQIPLFAQLGQADDQDSDEDGKIIGFALNPSVLGMYALILVRAAEIFLEYSESYRYEALAALKRLHRMPLSSMHHQTVQLSWAASAAHLLGKADLRDDFTHCLLLNCYRHGDTAGLFQGCSGLNYPAFRETVEAVEPWVFWLHESPQGLLLKQILEIVLYKSQKFIDKRISSGGLPQEGLSTLEQPEAGNIGVAIYAAPQVFELARIQRIYKQMH